MMSRMEIAKRALGLIDLTNLNDDCTAADIEDLCGRAQTKFGNTAAVCVWPRFVAQSASLLADTSIDIATVVNFPHGGTNIDLTVAETETALADGATEIDLVLPYHVFKDGDVATAQAMVQAIEKCVNNKALLKVIIEAGELKVEALITSASKLCLEAGADFIKTSTGKVAINATLPTARLMLQALADFGDVSRGFKPAGGIKSVDDCAAYLALADDILGPHWVEKSTFRFGASGVLNDVLAALEGGQATPTEDY